MSPILDTPSTTALVSPPPDLPWDVSGVGPKNARIAFVGEAPAKEEMRLKKPFIGNAGSVLDQLVHMAGLTRAETYITNLFKTEVRKTSGGDAFYIQGELAWSKKAGFTELGEKYRAALLDELKALQPNVVVTFGEPATYALTSLSGITKVRGSVVSGERGLKTIPAIHPAATFHNYLWRYLVIADLKKAKRHSVNKEMPSISAEYVYYRGEPIPTFFEHLTAVLNELAKEPELAVDIEVLNSEVSCVGIGNDETVAVVPFMLGKNHFWDLHQEAHFWDLIARIMRSSVVAKVFQNGLFDMSVMHKTLSIVPSGEWHDTMMAFKLLYPDLKKDLATISSIYTDVPYYKEEFKLWTERQRASQAGTDEILWRYNANDVFVTYVSWKELELELRDKELWPTYQRTMKLYKPLLYMEQRGIRVDKAKLEEMRRKVEHEEQALQAELDGIVGRPLNPRSTKEMQEYFYGEKRIKPYTDRKTRRPTVNDDALKRLAKGTAARPGLREASLIRSIRGLTKLRTVYLAIELDRDGRLRCSLNPGGTKNGRLSSSKTLFGTGTNMQNLPQQFKQFLLADPGKVLIEIDKKQGEWVLCAYVSGDTNMIKVVESGEDAHLATARLMFGVPADLVKEEAKVASHETDPDRLLELRRKYVPDILAYDIPSNMALRQAGKKANHGLNYDLGYRNFALINEIPERESKAIVDKYHAAYPGIRRMHQDIRDTLQKGRTLTNVFGRRRTFYDRWGDALFKDAYAFPAQSGLVDLVNTSLVATYNDPECYDVDLLMQVHDSILFQLPRPITEQGLRQIRKVLLHMDPVMEWRSRTFKIGSDVSMGLNWGNYHPVENSFGMREVDTSSVDSINAALFSKRLSI